MGTAGFWLLQGLNALQFSLLLFLLSIGLTVILGLMNFVNLAHGSFYAFGAFFGYSITLISGQFWLAILLSPILVAIPGMALYSLLQRLPNSKEPMQQVLLSFGLLFILLDGSRLLWGDVPLGLSPPPMLAGSIDLWGLLYPRYRLFLIALGLAVMLTLWLTLERSRIGAMIRASVDHADMAACLGVPVQRLFLLTFGVGCALAALAGVAAAPMLSIYPGMGADILVPTLIVVVIGGLGSLRGAIVGSALLGSIEIYGQILLPQLAGILGYVLLAAVLLWRPQGLCPLQK